MANDSAFFLLLNRDEALENARKVYSAQIELLRDLTDYGTNLIPRAFTSSRKSLRDVVVIAVLLRQVVAMLDAIQVLAASAVVNEASLQSRALFEACLYIEWILKSDGENKATHYYVHNLRRRRWLANALQSGTLEASVLEPTLRVLPTLKESAMVAEAKAQVLEIDRILGQPAFSVVNQRFERFKRKGTGMDEEWYAPFGVNSLMRLAEHCGRIAEYQTFYTSWSDMMHGSNYAGHVKFGANKRITFEPLRQLSRFPELVRTTISYAFHAYRAVLAEYRSGDLPAFSRKYVEDWKEAFLNITNVTYKVKELGLESGDA